MEELVFFILGCLLGVSVMYVGIKIGESLPKKKKGPGVFHLTDSHEENVLGREK